MKKLKIFYLCICINFTILGYCQQLYNLNSLDADITNISYGLYPANTFVKGTLTSASQVNNTTPEALINSILSENSLAWMNLNNSVQITELDAKATQNLNEKATLNKNLNYFQLDQIINFTYKNSLYKYIKYQFINTKTSKLPFGFILMVKKNNKWVRVNQFEDNNLILMNYTMTFFKFNFTKLDAIFRKNNLGNSLMTNIIAITNPAGGFSFSKLEQELNKWSFNKTSPEYIYFSENFNW